MSLWLRYLLPFLSIKNLFYFLFCITQAESTIPGLTYDLVRGLLRKGEVADRLDMCETLLRMGGANDADGLCLYFLLICLVFFIILKDMA